MKFKKRFLALALSLVLLIVGCSQISIPTNANTAFKNFTFCLFQQEVASNTINLHYSLKEPEKYGITNAPITLGSFDFNETSALASIENLDAALHKFSYNTLSDENKLTYDILSYYFDTLKTDATYYLYEEPLSPITGTHTQLPVLLAEYQFYDTEDVETYLALLETLPDYFSSLVRFEQQKAASGLFMADALVDEVVSQCNAFISMGDSNYLLSTFEERLADLPKLSSNEKTQFIQQNKECLSNYILPAYENLASSLTALKGSGKNTGGVCFLENGKDYYTHLVARETGSSRTISELKELIQSQILTDLIASQSVLEENPSITEQTVSEQESSFAEQTVSEQDSSLAEQISVISESPDNILTSLKTQISNAFPDYPSVNVQVKYVPTALEEYLSPAFYLIPAIDNYEENTIYINQGRSLTDINLFTTLAHEGYPGHLYQTTYFASTDPDPIRTILTFTGYVEGWATYAEMCSYYISSLEKSYATLLQKNNSIILGLYATADIGIHYDGWSVADTLSFFSAYGISDEAIIEEIYTYIVGDPANYLSYYVGYLEMLELKKEAAQKQGDSFSQKEFHQRILEIGPAPFEVVRKYLFET